MGGTLPPRLSPEGGNGKGGDQTSLLPQAVRAGVVPIAGTPLVCLLFYHLSLQIPITNLYVDYVDPLDLLFQKSCWRHPLLCRASIRTLNGPRWARCKLGSDLKPRSITTVTDLGCWVLPSTPRSLKDHSV